MCRSDAAELRRDFLIAVCEALKQYINEGGEVRLHTDRSADGAAADISFAVSDVDAFQCLVRDLSAPVIPPD